MAWRKHFVKSLRRPVRLIALLAWVAACHRDEQNEVLLEAPTPPVTATSRAIGSRPDPRPEQIAQVVRAKLERDPGVISTDGIRVGFDAGTIELTGTIDNLLSKRRAAKLAQTVRGVRAVSNRLEVRPAAIPDWRLTEVVRIALARNGTTESSHVKVEAKDSAVTLRGSVSSLAARDGVERLAEGVTGVRRVDNELLVTLKTKPADSEIEREVENRLRWDALVDIWSINVKVEGGIVNLQGHVASPAERDRALTLAGLVPGALAVNADGLAVRVANEDGPAHARVKPKDGDITEALKRAIEIDPRLASSEIQPVVNGGMVTLRGRVDSAAAKFAAADLAQNTVGVLEVANELTIEPGRPVSDAVLQRRILSEINLDPFVTAGRVDVRVDRGIVTLTGLVEDSFARAQAEHAAMGLRGVVRVINQLELERPEQAYIFDVYLEPYAPAVQNYAPPTTTKTDRQIEEAIGRELTWSPFVDANQVNVHVLAGKATLTGAVETKKERKAAVDNAFEGGALSVDNRLLVKDSVLARPPH